MITCLLRVTAGRTLLAYNAAYDHAILVEQRPPVRGRHRAPGRTLAMGVHHAGSI